MRVETLVKSALPSDMWSRWSDEQLAVVFANGANILNTLNKTAINRTDQASMDIALDYQYLQSQLGRFGLNLDNVLDIGTFKTFHGVFDIRPVVAAYQRKISPMKADLMTSREALPFLEASNTALQTQIDRTQTFIGVLMRHSFTPVARFTDPQLYKRLGLDNPEGRYVDQIRILQLPSIVRPADKSDFRWQ